MLAVPAPSRFTFTDSGVTQGSYTETLASVGKLILWKGDGTLTLPSNAPKGTTLSIFKWGTTYSATIAGGGGDTINVGLQNQSTFVIGLKVGFITLVKEDAAIWAAIAGDLNLMKSGLFAYSAGDNGYQVLPTGIIYQWGFYTANASDSRTVTLPLTFPNAFYKVNISCGNGSSSYSPRAIPTSTSTFQTTSDTWNAANNPSTRWQWDAIGS